jgi:plastocyanin
MRRIATAAAIAACVGLLSLLSLLPLAAGTRPAPREVMLVARDMVFYLEGSETPNPTIQLAAGEDVRLVLRNDDPGITHQFAIADWQIESSTIKGKGTTTVLLHAPDEPGRHAYVCSPHASMMTGTIEVRR